MVLSGNKKTTYYHALFIYNQTVTRGVVNVAIKKQQNIFVYESYFITTIVPHSAFSFFLQSYPKH